MIVENKSELNQFFDIYNKNQVIIIPVLSDKEKHVLNNRISFLYIKIIGYNKYYIIPINHTECINLDIGVLSKLNSNNIKYTPDKKILDNIISMDNVIDINSLYYLTNNEIKPLDYKMESSEYLIMKNSPFEMENINDIIPIMIHIKRLVKESNELENMIDTSLLNTKPLDFFNKTLTSLQQIEKNGIHVDTDKLLKYFPFYENHIKNNLIYSEYNPFTLTGRPSNKFGRLNFLSLNKNNGEREIITSRFGNNGKIVVFDYDAYHLNLIATIIKYKFPSNESVHEYLGKQYFEKDTLTNEEYHESKKVSFNILYGGIDKSVSDIIPFFAKTDEFITYIWEKFQSNGYIETLISHKRFYKYNLPDINKNKLFNYILQNFETETNILIIEQINKLLKLYNSKLILYYYDGFIFDYDIRDGKDLMIKLSNIISDSGKYKYKKFYGDDFHNLIKF